jgi:hypothetical protein
MEVLVAFLIDTVKSFWLYWLYSIKLEVDTEWSSSRTWKEMVQVYFKTLVWREMGEGGHQLEEQAFVPRIKARAFQIQIWNTYYSLMMHNWNCIVWSFMPVFCM